MWRALWERIKEALRRMLPKGTIENTLHITPIVSNKMKTALELWDAMYKDEAPWLREPSNSNPVRVASLGLPSFIASEKARMAVIEMQSEIAVPKDDKDTKSAKAVSEDIETVKTSSKATDRAEWLNKAYQEKVLPKLRTQLEYGIAKGGLVIKPYVVMNTVMDNGKSRTEPSVEIEFIQADYFFPLAFDGGGNITDAAFVQTKVVGEVVYTRLERHTLENGKVVVRNRAFRNTTAGNLNNDSVRDSNLGQEIPLKEVPEWKDLKPEQTIINIDRLLFAYFKMPEANTVDPMSPLGVSGYSRAVNLIKQADMQYSRLLWEFEATEAAVDIDRDALLDVADNKGQYHYVNTVLQQRLFRRIDLGESNTYQPYSPAIRDVSLINGLNTLLMRIEDVCALSRGTISDAAAEARTATELKILKQRTYQANVGIQEALQKALQDVVYIMNVYATLYEIVGEGEYEASFEWDDSILVDVDTELQKRMTLMQNGLASKLELRMWYFGETEEQAREALKKIHDESMESMEEDIANRKALGEKAEENDELN